ncbi:hypothetical protein STRTUCAR8_06163 [Streptomyces turgidiscabies Car8]|uniref:Uncharacterized protein n=1 Tax=Streptomyces turgidiscabies (strain Car8) TaxID=698760 RepID=L7ERT1_STRT8|nr:hypothetical protein STRTUCAR8_06163 [Streptomyces turgidiscabies Car8]
MRRIEFGAGVDVRHVFDGTCGFRASHAECAKDPTWGGGAEREMVPWL